MKRFVWAAAVVFAACASEEWDNRFDPEGTVYRAPCADAPGEERALCVLWEEFDRGLSGWQVAPSPDGVEGVRIDAAAPAGIATVLRMPACPDGKPGLAREVDEPAAPLTLEVVWRLEDPKAAKVSLPLRGVAGDDSLVTTAPAAAPFEGWQLTTVDFTGGGEAAFFGLDCAPSAFWVARIALRKPAP